MKWQDTIKIDNLIEYLFLLTLAVLCLFSVTAVKASSTSSVNATVKVSVCGDGIIESGEDCESGNLQGKTCSNLGYSGGSLTCDISCSFNTSSCSVPIINPDDVLPNKISSLLPAGYFTIPQTASMINTPSLTATNQVTFNIPQNSGTASVILPKNLVITRTDGANLDPTALTTATVTTSSLSGFSANVSVDGALQWGIPTASLEFGTPATLNIYVGTQLNGQTLNVVRSSSTSSGWTTDGIVAPATCTVLAGLCTFRVTKASYFATTRTIASSSSSSSTSAGSSSTSSSSSSSSSAGSTATTTSTTQTTVLTTTPTPEITLVLPQILQMFYVDSSGKIRVGNIFNIVKTWVDAWKETVLAETVGKKQPSQPASVTQEKCDVNSDGECNLKDLSVLLYYVER